MKLRRTTEDYLKTIYLLSQKTEVHGAYIAEALGVSKPTVSISLKALEQDGYLYLQPGRGRAMHVCLTPEGRRLVEEKAAPVAAMEERAFSGMPQEDQQALLRLTHAYLARLRAEAGRIL